MTLCDGLVHIVFFFNKVDIIFNRSKTLYNCKTYDAQAFKFRTYEGIGKLNLVTTINNHNLTNSMVARTPVFLFGIMVCHILGKANLIFDW